MAYSTRDKIRKMMGAPYAGVGASDKSLGDLITAIGHQLPEDYLAFMRETNGYVGEVGRNGFVSIWEVDEILPTNLANHYREWIPGLVLFASNEGGDFYAFDMRRAEVTPVVSVPAIPVCLEEASEVGASFVNFLERLSETT